MNIIGAKEIALEVDKILGCDSEVCDFDDETVYVNTGEESLDFDELWSCARNIAMWPFVGVIQVMSIGFIR